MVFFHSTEVHVSNEAASTEVTSQFSFLQIIIGGRNAIIDDAPDEEHTQERMNARAMYIKKMQEKSLEDQLSGMDINAPAPPSEIDVGSNDEDTEGSEAATSSWLGGLWRGS